MLQFASRTLLAVAICVSSGFVSAQTTVEAALSPHQPPLIGPFRGVAPGFPEYSLEGMARALEIGVDIVSVRVQVTADGHHVIFTDRHLNRLTDVETVFEIGPSGGPTREERMGRDYMSDYTLAELRRLHLLLEGEPTDSRIPTLQEALDLVGDQCLVLIALYDFDLDTLVADLAGRYTANLLVYNADPEILSDVVTATGLPAFANITRSRVFDTPDNVAILDASHAILGDAIVLAHINSSRLVTPELLSRVAELGVLLSVDGGREDFALENGDTQPWLETLEMDAAVFWTPFPEQVLDLAGR